MSWREVEEALNHLLEAGWENEPARRYVQRFRRARSQVSSLFLQMMDSRDPQERQVAAFVLGEIGGKQVIRSLQEMFWDPALGEYRRPEVEEVLQRLGVPLPEAPKPAPPVAAEKAPPPRKPSRSRPSSKKADRKAPAPPAEGAPAPTAEIQALCQKESGEILAVLEDDRMLNRILEALPHLPGQQQQEFLEKIGQPGAQPALRVLLPLLQGNDWPLVEGALTALEKVGLPEAIPALEEVAERSPRRRLKVRARRILREIGSQAPPPSPEAAPEEVGGPLYRAYATPVRGDGSQTLLVIREQPEGGLKLLRIRHNDEEGLLECQFEGPLTRPALRTLLGQLRANGEWPIEVPLGYCDQMLLTAANLTGRRKRPLPPEYQAAQQFCAARRASSQVVLKLDPAPQIDRLEETPKLMSRPEFQSWTFEVSRHPALLQLWEQARGRPEASRQRQAAITQLIRAEVDDAFLARLRTRLQRQALLLQRIKETEASEWACVAAAGLLKKFDLPVEEHPFLRQMAAFSFQQALGEEETVRLSEEGVTNEASEPALPEAEAESQGPAELESPTGDRSLGGEEVLAEGATSAASSPETPRQTSPLWPRSGRRRWVYSSHSRSRRLR